MKSPPVPPSSISSAYPVRATFLTAETLIDLLNEGTERPGLDYKRRLDLSSKRETVAIAKDLGAMQVAGGYIVIGGG